jgi:hypothetical protein
MGNWVTLDAGIHFPRRRGRRRDLGFVLTFDFRIAVLVCGRLTENFLTASNIKTNGFILIVDFLDFLE